MKQILLALIFLIGLPLNVFAASTLIYDADQGSPVDQGWSLYDTTKGTYQVSNGLLTYDSTGYPYTNQYRFYKTFDFDFDHTAGLTIEFSAQVHSNDSEWEHRSGFVFYFFAHDSQAIQIYFADDRVFYAGSSSLKQEEYLMNTTAGLVDYRLEVLNNGFSFYADETEILSGSLYDYGFTNTNYLSIGDHTQSASGSATFGSIQVTADFIEPPAPSVPEPATVVLMISCLMALYKKLI